jgi:hypothetical protein
MKTSFSAKTLIFPFLFLCSSMPLLARPPGLIWMKTFGGPLDDRCHSIQQTNDGGFILCGYTQSFGAGKYDVWVVRTDSLGDTLWTRTIGTIAAEQAYSIHLTHDGGFILFGTSYASVYYDAYLVKLDSLGSVSWTRTVTRDVGTYDRGLWGDITSDSGFVIAGTSPDLWLAKTDSTGTKLWDHTYSMGVAEPSFVKQTYDGNFLLAGRTGQGVSSDASAMIARGSGSTLYSQSFGLPNSSDAFSFAAQTRDSGFIFVGTTESYGSGSSDVYLVRLDSLRYTKWSKTFGGSLLDIGYFVHEMPDSGYIIGGSTTLSPGAPKSAWVIRTDKNADTIWTSTVGGDSNSTCNYVLPISDSTYFFSGYTNSFGAGGWDFWLVKLGYDFVPPSVALFSPNGGEQWGPGDTRSIAWSASDNGTIASRSIYFSSDSASNWILLDSSKADVLQNWSWTIPLNISSRKCFLKVFVYDYQNNIGAAQSTRIFAITDTTPPSVAITSPNGGEAFAAGSKIDVTWTCSDNIGLELRTIYLSTDNKASWSQLDRAHSDTGSGSWELVLPSALYDQCWIRIDVLDKSGNLSSDTTDGPFRTISLPFIVSPDSVTINVGDDFMYSLEWDNPTLNEAIVYHLQTPSWAFPVANHVAGKAPNAPAIDTIRMALIIGTWSDTITVRVFIIDPTYIAVFPNLPFPIKFDIQTTTSPARVSFLVTLEKPSNFSLNVYSTMGRLLCRFRKPNAVPGVYRFFWDIHSAPVPPSGVYLVFLNRQDMQILRKIPLLR